MPREKSDEYYILEWSWCGQNDWCVDSIAHTLKSAQEDLRFRRNQSPKTTDYRIVKIEQFREVIDE